MSNSRRSTLTWSHLHQCYELRTNGDNPQCFSEGNECAFSTWLEAHTSFAFVGQSGRLSVLKEARTRGSGYWYAYRKQGQRTHKRYLGPSSQVTFARLEDLARLLARVPPSPAQQVPERTTTLLTTKLAPPRLPGFLVERPRLLRDLDTIWIYPLTLVSSSAGSGKTTLLSAWASRQENQVAWLSLDSLDTDPTRFWTACITALRRCLPTLGEEALSMLHAPQSPPLSTILVTLLNEIVLIKQEFILILDDYHMISDRAIHEGLLFIFDHQPTNLHLVLSTRTDPELPLSRFRVRRQLLEIRSSELRFTQEETTSFLVQRMNLPLSEEEVAMLENRTEGWIAGLQLVALSLSKQQDLSRAIADFGGSHRYLLDYVQQDILAQLPDALQGFLLQTSIVSRMNAAICLAVTDESTHEICQQMLEEVERANLFVVPLDEHRQWYRYHDLFREALQARLQTSQPELVPLLHVRAAHWYETQGELREAIAHALAAADYAYAANLMEQAAPRFWLNGEARVIHNWVQALPDAVLHTHLHLALNAAFRFLNSASLDTGVGHTNLRIQVERTCTRLEGILRGKRTFLVSNAEEALVRLRLRVLCALIETRSLVKQGDLAYMQQLTREIEILPPDEDMSWNVIRFTLLFFLAVVLQGEGAFLIPRLRAAQQSMREEDDPLVAIRIMIWLAHSFIQAGQLHQARQECQQGLALIERIGGCTPWEGQLYYALFLVSYTQHRLEEAANWLKLMFRIAQDWQQVELLVMGEIFSTRLALTRRDLGAAQQSFQRLEALMARERFAARAPWMNILRVQLWLMEGNLEAAMAWAERRTVLGETWNPMYRWEVLMAVRVYLTRRHFPQALEILSHFREHLEQPGAFDTAIERMALSVIALYGSGKHQSAMQLAARLLALIEPEDYIRLDLDTDEPLMKEVLTIWLKAQPDEISQASSNAPSRPSVKRLITLLEREEEQRFTRGQEILSVHSLNAFPQSVAQHTLIEPLSRKEQQVLRLLVAGQTYTEMAQTLIVSPNTIKTQVSSIYRKLGVSRRVEAIATSQALHLL